jgi:hypothetical protein
MTNPVAETKSIGLPANALAVMVFASPPRQFYRDGTTRGRLPGLRHLLSNYFFKALNFNLLTNYSFGGHMYPY